MLGTAKNDAIGLAGTFSEANGIEVIDGGGGKDTLLGSTANDAFDFRATTLIGIGEIDLGAGDDTVIGTTGADTLTGGAGADRFVYTALGQSVAGSGDEITDFEAGTDRLDLTAIDANGDPADGDTAFTFIGVDADFTGTAGELRFLDKKDLLQGDLDGDGVADFEVTLAGVRELSANDIDL